MACGNCRGSACSNKEKIEISEIPGEDEATIIGMYHKYNTIDDFQDLENNVLILLPLLIGIE